MKDFFLRNKVFIIIIAITVILLLGGIMLFSGSPAPNPSTNKVDTSLLVSPDSFKSSGYANGNYLPASPSATTTLVEFGDYECPACGVYSPMVKQLLTDFAGKITFVFRNYPLSQHSNALISSYAVEAAGLQGKFWEMHDKMYSTQSDWENLSSPKSTFIGYAKDMGLNVNQFSSDMDSPIVKNKVQNDINNGNSVGLTETPTFYLNNLKITLTGSYDQLKNLVKLIVN